MARRAGRHWKRLWAASKVVLRSPSPQAWRGSRRFLINCPQARSWSCRMTVTRVSRDSPMLVKTTAGGPCIASPWPTPQAGSRCRVADLLWLESPSNPMLTVADLDLVCAAPPQTGRDHRRGQHLRNPAQSASLDARRRCRRAISDEVHRRTRVLTLRTARNVSRVRGCCTRKFSTACGFPVAPTVPGRPPSRPIFSRHCPPAPEAFGFRTTSIHRFPPAAWTSGRRSGSCSGDSAHKIHVILLARDWRSSCTPKTLTSPFHYC
jgi:hypothetical protein